LYGKVRSIETKDKIRLATAGINNPMFGKSHTIYSKNLISLALSKPVYRYKIVEDKFELYDIYPNSVEVGKLLNLNKTTIGRYIRKNKIFR
jgi:NUMOD3 motif